METAAHHEVLVLGIGNPLMGDDGAGVRALELLADCDLPAHVHLQEIGTPGWGIGAWFENQSSVVLIDAVQMGLPPGAWKKIDLQDVRLLAEEAPFSLHQTGLASGLLLAQELNLLPRNIILYGIEPADLTPRTTLSPQVEASLPGLVNIIVKDFHRGKNEL